MIRLSFGLISELKKKFRVQPELLEKFLVMLFLKMDHQITSVFKVIASKIAVEFHCTRLFFKSFTERILVFVQAISAGFVLF